MKKLNFLLTLSLALISMQSCNTSNNSKDTVESAQEINDEKESLSSKSSDFMVEAANGGMMEVQLGEIAQQNAMSQSVKNFGAMMVKDHGNANADLKTLASAKKVTLPAAVGGKHQQHITDLTQLKGSEFDAKYINMMVDDHKKDIDLFEDAADSEDADVKAFAAKTLPILKMHLDSAKAINDRLKNSKNQ